MRMPKTPVAIHKLSRACRLSPSFMFVALWAEERQDHRPSNYSEYSQSSVAEMCDAAFAATGALGITTGVSIPVEGQYG